MDINEYSYKEWLKRNQTINNNNLYTEIARSARKRFDLFVCAVGGHCKTYYLYETEILIEQRQSKISKHEKLLINSKSIEKKLKYLDGIHQIQLCVFLHKIIIKYFFPIKKQYLEEIISKIPIDPNIEIEIIRVTKFDAKSNNRRT